jgi:3-hydroxybutyryl-CoA dehydrogenase
MTGIATIGVVGAGAMGRGIAELAARSGFDVRLTDSAEDAVARAVAAIGEALRRDVDKGRFDAAEADAIRARIATASLAEVARADLVIEAIVEDLAAKQALFRALDAEARPDAILATNTSSLSVGKIAEAVRDPGRFAGFHFFNPPTRMRVVEIVRGPKTADATVAALEAVSARLGQRALLVADTPGFLVNHLGRGYTGEALRLLDEGVASAADIDAIARGALGFRMGPFELLDLTGLDVSAEVTRQVWKGFGEEPRFKLAPVAEKRVAMGLVGRKTGRGFYDYDSDWRVRAARPAVARAVDDEPAAVRLVGIPSDLVPGVAALFPAQHMTTRPDAIAVVGPIGIDTATEAQRHGLDPSVVVGVDPVFTGVAAISGADTGRLAAVSRAVATAKKTAVIVRDGQGMPAQRLAAMIVLIAAEAAAHGLASPGDIDAATRLALAYPRGPLELGDWVGASRIAAISAGLFALTGDPRWRRSAWLDARAKMGLSLAETSPALEPAPN